MRRRAGLAVLLFGLAALTTAATTAAVTLPAVRIAAVQDAPPPPAADAQDEASLWKAVQDAVSSGRFWAPETLAMLQRFVKEYPASGNVGAAKWHIVQHEMHHGRRQQAVDLCQEIVEKHSGSVNAPDAQLVVASWLVQQRRKDDAKAAFKKLFKLFPASAASRNGLWQYWNLVDKAFQFGIHQSYTEGQQVVVHGSLRNIDRIDYRLYRLDPEALRRRFDEVADPGSIQDLVASVPPESRRKLKEWTDEPEVGRRWKQVEVKPEIAEPGFYVLEAEHDEIPVQVGIVVARYGLIVKSAPNRSVVFAVDRRTGRAIEGMELRFAQGKERITGQTDADGLFVLDRGINGAVVGVKDGDIALSNLWTQQDSDEARGYVLTDRPIYRPNQVVHFKITHRTLKRGKPGVEADELVTTAGQDAAVTIHDPRHNVIYQKTMKTGPNGSVAGQFQLGDEPPLGHYSVTSSLGGYGQFRVEEYRKPEYEVKVKFQGAPYVQGDDLKGEISVDYYFGSPVVEADVAWELWKAPYYPMRWYCFRGEWDWDGGYDDDEDDESPRHHYGRGERVAQGSGRTDKAGRLSVTAPTAKDGKDVRYTLIAKVVDKSRREVSGEASAKVTRAQIELQASASKYVYRPGDSVVFKVRAADLDGKPVKDQEISIVASTASWRRRERDSGYEYGEFCTAKVRTDAQGVADFTFPADKEGYIRVRARTEDRRGTEVAAEHWMWISGRSWSADFSNFTGLDVVPDRESYGPGEQAQVLITSQHRNVHVLFTVECGAIHRQEVVTVKGHTAVVEVPVDVRAFSPNVYFSATALVGNEFLSKSKSVAVPPADRLLSVKVSTDKAAYRPREPMQVTIEAKDAGGRPVEAELAVSIVDESIYALQSEFARDIRKFFYAKRWNRTATSTSLHYSDYGRAGWGGDKGGGGGPQGAAMDPRAPAERGRNALSESLKRKEDSDHNESENEAETEVRGNFPDTMYWTPLAVTGADGRFTFTAAAPDSLTTWRTTVRGMTPDSRVGLAKLETIVRKEVIVRLEAPRFFTQNDVCTVSGVVHNYRDDVSEVRVVLEASGVELLDDAEHRLKIAKGEDKRIDWRIAVKRPGEAKLTAKALSSKESDAMQLSIPVLPHGTPRYVAKSGLSEAGAKASVTLPATAIAEATELTIAAEPSVAAQVATCLEYLAGYPYGCVEQTMSRFLPSVTAGRAMANLGVKNPKLEEKLPDMVAKGVQRLYNFQHGDGGWGWWEADETHPFMTAYVVYGLAKAREAGFAVDENVLRRGVAALQQMVKARATDTRRRYQEAPLDTRAYLVFALAEAGAAEKESVTELFERRTELSDYAKALVAISLARSARLQEARDVLANLDETAKEGGSFCYWTGHSQRWHWMSHDIETTGYVLRAYVLADAKNPRIGKIVRWLAANRHGNRWHSTKDTAAVVYALSEFVAVSGELDADYTLVVKVDGREILKARATKENLLTFDGRRVLKGAEVPAGAREITFEKEGKGSLYWAVHLKYFDAAETFEPLKSTISIERSYARVSWEGKDKVSEPLKDGDAVKPGDLIEVTLDVSADGLHEYLMIEDPLPAGFEVQKEERFHGGWAHRRWNAWYSRMEARDERVCIAATTMNGNHTVTYLMRAEQPGDFRVLPARVYNMYVPEIAAASAGSRIKVEDAK